MLHRAHCGVIERRMAGTPPQFDACGAPAALWDAVMQLETVADVAELLR